MKFAGINVKYSRYLKAGRWLLLLLPGGIAIFFLVEWLRGRERASVGGD